jgi:hypothetical protein
MNLKKTALFFAVAAFMFQAFAACDMEFILHPGSAPAAGASADGPESGGGAGTGWSGDGPTIGETAALTPEQIAALTPEQIAALIEEQEKNAEAVAEMEKNGRYLLVYNLPATTAPEHVSGVKVTDGQQQAARADSLTPVLIDYSGTAYRHAYIPLVSQNGAPFARTGFFYVEFSVRIDALTRIFVTSDTSALVSFSDGRGSVDVEKLFRQDPGIIVPVENPDPAAAAEAAAEAARTEEQIGAIVASGSYIRFFSLPVNISKAKFSNVSVLDAASAAARPSDYEGIAVRSTGLSAEAFVPLAQARGGSVFRETGSYFVWFSITVDALRRITAGADNPVLSVFTDGNAHIDVTDIPPLPVPPPLSPHRLTLTGLPPETGPANFTGVFILNSEGVAAKCADYTKIEVTGYAGKRAALIPLVYDNNHSFNGQDFSDSGHFIVTFSFVSDALQNITASERNNCVVSFTEGCAALDAGSIPPVPHKYLTVTNLPANTQELNVSNVFIWNQAGKTAQCESYGLLLFERNGASSTLRIPLVYTADTARLFEETGNYNATFDLNIDALTRIVISEKEKVLVSFVDGNGSLDADKLPQALPVPYLSIIGLPANTAKNNFSEVFLYNAAGKIARCANYPDIIVSKGPDAASAMIPLVYDANPSEYFRDSGPFAVSFTINVDINTQIIKTRQDALPAHFTDGSGQINLAADYGYFSGGLLNPDDTAPPVIKKGTVFEINGSYAVIKNDTPVKPAAFSYTSAVYVYAVQKIGAVEFEYSATAPSFVQAKNGYYSGDARALYRMVYLRDSVDKYAAKTFINDPWRHFETFPVDKPAIASTMNKSAWYSLSGSGDPQPKTVSLSAGAYVLILSGAGGGGGGGIDVNLGSFYDFYGLNGGQGGLVSELVTLSSSASVTVFTGQGGDGAGAAENVYYNSGDINGKLKTGNGGGGSGTFIFSEAARYLLCAGGGGGGGGSVPDSPGGEGGSIGSGGGGASGSNSSYTDIFSSQKKYYDAEDGIDYRPSGGGAGGGWLGGAGGVSVYIGYSQDITATYWQSGDGNGNVTISGTRTIRNYNTGAGGAAGYALPIANRQGSSAGAEYEGTDSWKNTNGANGQGACLAAGGAGGNNRNGIRGGGAAGGAGGIPSNSPASAGAGGGHGSVLIYKIF